MVSWPACRSTSFTDFFQNLKTVLGNGATRKPHRLCAWRVEERLIGDVKPSYASFTRRATPKVVRETFFWTRAGCGRIKSDYCYSKDVVYNNFLWPTLTDTQKAKIKQTAQAILDAHALYPDSSLADPYDELTMPQSYGKLIRKNDRKQVCSGADEDISSTDSIER